MTGTLTTDIEMFDPQFFTDTTGNFFQSQPDPNLQIPAAIIDRSGTASPTENILKPKTAKITHKGAQGVRQIETFKAEAARKAGSLSQPGMTELIIPLPFGRVFEDFVGFGGFLEFQFRLGVAGIAIGMKFQGQLDDKPF